MQITIYAKKRTTSEGRTFYTYLTRLVKNSTGEVVPVEVKFRESAGKIDGSECPKNIIVEKADCNMSSKYITAEDGSQKEVLKMWVSKFKNGADFVDTSMDDYM